MNARDSLVYGAGAPVRGRRGAQDAVRAAWSPQYRPCRRRRRPTRRLTAAWYRAARTSDSSAPSTTWWSVSAATTSRVTSTTCATRCPPREATVASRRWRSFAAPSTTCVIWPWCTRRCRRSTVGSVPCEIDSRGDCLCWTTKPGSLRRTTTDYSVAARAYSAPRLGWTDNSAVRRTLPGPAFSAALVCHIYGCVAWSRSIHISLGYIYILCTISFWLPFFCGYYKLFWFLRNAWRDLS